ncbi:ABC transporter ATP-binding protein, partial [Kitasatospora sp. NPDC056783]
MIDRSQTFRSSARGVHVTFPATAVHTGRAAARATSLNKVYGEGETRVVALDNVSVTFPQGEFTAIM